MKHCARDPGIRYLPRRSSGPFHGRRTHRPDQQARRVARRRTPWSWGLQHTTAGRAPKGRHGNADLATDPNNALPPSRIGDERGADRQATPRPCALAFHARVTPVGTRGRPAGSVRTNGSTPHRLSPLTPPTPTGPAGIAAPPAPPPPPQSRASNSRRSTASPESVPSRPRCRPPTARTWPFGTPGRRRFDAEQARSGSSAVDAEGRRRAARGPSEDVEGRQRCLVVTSSLRFARVPTRSCRGGRSREADRRPFVAEGIKSGPAISLAIQPISSTRFLTGRGQPGQRARAQSWELGAGSITHLATFRGRLPALRRGDRRTSVGRRHLQRPSCVHGRRQLRCDGAGHVGG
jgi:hypothetical protein